MVPQLLSLPTTWQRVVNADFFFMHCNVWLAESSHDLALWWSVHDQVISNQYIIFLMIFRKQLTMFAAENWTSKCNVNVFITKLYWSNPAFSHRSSYWCDFVTPIFLWSITYCITQSQYCYYLQAHQSHQCIMDLWHIGARKMVIFHA